MNSDGYLPVTDLRALVIGIQFDAADLELDETVKSIMTDSLIGITNLSCPFPPRMLPKPSPPPWYRFFLNLLAGFISCPSPVCKMSPLSQKTENQKHHQEKMCYYYEFKVKERQNIKGIISTKTGQQRVSKTTNGSNILHGFKCYRGGWNITNRHYWAVSICFFYSL